VVAKLKLAIDFTKINQERAISFHFGTIVPAIRYKDSAVTAYQSVIDMNRKADRKFVIHMLKKQNCLIIKTVISISQNI
jgi:hypothetical protein